MRETGSEMSLAGPHTLVNSTTVEDLNDSQYEALKKLKKNISEVLPPHYSDAWLIKLLKSHNYNIKQAEALFRAYRRQHEVYRFDTIVENYVKPEVCKKYECTTHMGFAKNGSPIRYNPVGRGDLLGFLMSLDGYEICLYLGYVMEYDKAMIKKANEKGGREVSEVTYIFDLEGFSIQTLMSKSAIETGLDLVQMMQDIYPDIWGNIFFINAPSYFDLGYNIFKPILRLNLIQKMKVASKDSTPALLRNYIDEDVLPVSLGGKRTDSRGDPNCSEFIPGGGVIPEEYYLRNTVPAVDPSEPLVTSMWLAARSVHNYCAVVKKADSQIRVDIRSETGSVGLKMLYREFGDDLSNLDLPSSDEYLDENHPGSNVVYVSPFIRLQTHTTPVYSRMVRAPWPGIYIFRFDNTHSWFRSQKVTYRFQVFEET